MLPPTEPVVTPPAGDPPKGKETEPESFSAWIEIHPEAKADEIKTKYDLYTKKLQTALVSERDKSKDAEKQTKRLAELEEAEAKRKGEQLSEKEKLEAAIAEKEKAIAAKQAELDRAQTEMVEIRTRNAITLEASKQGFADPDDAYTLADKSGVEIGKDGKITGVKEALEALAKAKPYLLKTNGKPPGTPLVKPPVKPTEKKTEPAKPIIRF